MERSVLSTRPVLLIISSFLLSGLFYVRASDDPPLEITGHGTTGPGGWDLTVLAQRDSNGVTGSISVLGGATGPVIQLVPPEDNGCGCWCINARRTDVIPAGPDYRENVYIRDVGDGITSFDQFSLVSGIGIDCSFPTGDLFFMPIRQGDFKGSQGINTAPVVAWIQPADGSVFPGGSAVVLTAQATDSDGTVSFVDFFADATHLGRVAGSPTNNIYNFTWSNPPDGHFQLHAVAIDNAGGRGISGSVRIFVGDGNPLPIDLGTVETSTIGHSFFGVPPFPSQMPRSVVDYLIDQDQSSGGGGVLPSLSVNWDTNSQFSLTVSAPAGQKFLVKVPAGRAVGFGGFLWWESTRGGLAPPGPVTATFGGLEGTAPDLVGADAVLSHSHGFFGFVDLESTTVSNDFAFTSVTLTGTVAPQYTGSGTEYYIPHLESSMQLYYTTSEATDPGPFVSIVPVQPADAPTPREAIELMILRITESSHPTRVKRPLMHSLMMCCDKLDRGEGQKAAEVLQAFQRKIVVQLGRGDPAFAQLLINSAQTVIATIAPK